MRQSARDMAGLQRSRNNHVCHTWKSSHILESGITLLWGVEKDPCMLVHLNLFEIRKTLNVQYQYCVCDASNVNSKPIITTRSYQQHYPSFLPYL
jgi:hypothetical protein